MNWTAKSAKDERVQLLQDLAELIATARSLNLPETAFLLDIAHLGLRAKIHGISNVELQAFADHIRSQIEND